MVLTASPPPSPRGIGGSVEPGTRGVSPSPGYATLSPSQGERDGVSARRRHSGVAPRNRRVGTRGPVRPGHHVSSSGTAGRPRPGVPTSNGRFMGRGTQAWRVYPENSPRKGSGKGKAPRRQRTPRRGRGPAARSRARERPGVRRCGAAVGGKGTERPFSCEVTSQNGRGNSWEGHTPMTWRRVEAMSPNSELRAPSSAASNALSPC